MHAIKALVAAAVVAAMLPATAAQFDFYKLGRGTADAMNKDFLPIDGVPCTNGELCSSNVEAVPKPGSYALFVAGLGALGFVPRRRKPARSSAGPHDMRVQDP